MDCTAVIAGGGGDVHFLLANGNARNGICGITCPHGNAANQANQLYLNNGSANPFNGVSGTNITADAHYTRSVALGDVDGDGDLDPITGDIGVNQLYRRQQLYHTAQGEVGSIRVDTDSTPINHIRLTASAMLPPNTRIDYWVSNTGGGQWFQVQSGRNLTFPTNGTDLRWRATLHSLSPTLSPRLDQIDLARLETVLKPIAGSWRNNDTDVK